METRPFAPYRALQVTVLLGLVGLALLALCWAGSRAGAALAAPLAAPPAGPIVDSPAITIGLAVGLTGPAEQIGWQEANAVQLAVSQTNAAGGVDIGGVTHTLVLVVVDDMCDPTQAITAAQALLDAGAVAVVGHTCSGASWAAQPLYYSASVAMVSPSSTRVDLTQQGYDTTFRVCARDDSGGVRLATHLMLGLGITRTAMVERDGLPLASAEAFSTTYTALGGQITSRHTVYSAADYTATLAAIQPEGPGAIYYLETNPGEAGFFSHVAADVGGMDGVPVAWDAVWEYGGGLWDYVSAAGAAAAGDMATYPQRLPADMPGYAAFNAAYQAAGFPNYGSEAGLFGALAYDDALLIVEAIERAASADPAAIRDALAATPPYAGVVGNYQGFDGNGDVLPQWAWIYPLAGPWQPLGGPKVAGGQATEVAIDPVLADTLYTTVGVPGDGVFAGIYASGDGAASWSTLYNSPQRLKALAAGPSALYAAGSANRGDTFIIRSTNGGADWTTVLTGTGEWWNEIETLVVDPVSSSVVYAAGGYGGPVEDLGVVWRTVDGGDTWTEALTVPAGCCGAYFVGLAVDPVSHTNVYAAGYESDVDGSYASIYRSDDGGDSWTRVYTATDPAGGGGMQFTSLAVHPLTPTTIYAGTGWGANYVYRSTDGGVNWTAVYTGAGFGLAVQPPNTVYALADWGEVVSSTLGGDPGTWNHAGQTPDRVRSLALDADAAPPALYAGLEHLGVFKSTDGGATWEERNSGIESAVLPHDIDIDPEDSARLFVAAESGGGWRSEDGGGTWEWLPLPNMGSFAFTPQDPAVVFGGAFNCAGGTIFRSSDGGLSFAPVFTPTFVISDCSGGDEGILAMEVSAALSSTVYAVGYDHPAWNPDQQAVALRSLDGGISWTVVLTLPARSHFEAMAIDPAEPDRVYVGGEDCSGGPCQGVLYRSEDGGQSWTAVLTASATVRSMTIDPQKTCVVYAGLNDYSLWKSTDCGENWTVIRTCCPSGNLLVVDPFVPSHVYLGGWGYIAESRDGGLTFSDDPMNVGVPPMEPRALAVTSDGVEETLYAGLSGVWAYHRPAPQPGEPVELRMWTDPPSGTVYANGLDGVFYRALALDVDGNWVADQTPVTVTYDLHELGSDDWTVVKRTVDGQVRGGVFGVAAAATVTFTAGANIRAASWVTGTFLYNPPAGITITGAPVSLTVGGASGPISATVAGLHGGVASDGTAVGWATTLGEIVAATWTTRGLVTTTLTTGNLTGTAVITATVDGFSDTTTVAFVGGAFEVYLPLVMRQQ